MNRVVKLADYVKTTRLSSLTHEHVITVPTPKLIVGVAVSMFCHYVEKGRMISKTVSMGLARQRTKCL